MFNWSFRRAANETEAVSVGIFVETRQVTITAIDGEVDGRPHVRHWDSRFFDGEFELQGVLREFVEAHSLAGKSCRCILPAEDYSLRLVERPANVPDEELVDATRWLIRDLIEFDVEAAEFSIFPVPEEGNRARTPRMFVAAARQEAVAQIVKAIESSGLRLAGLEITETAMLSLENWMPEPVAGGAMLRIDDKTSVLTVAKHDNLYLSRQMNVDSDAIDDAARMALEAEHPADPEILAMIDGTLLDLQRSLDYYESEYGQAAASRLTLLPSSIDMTPLIPTLAEAFRPMQIECFEPLQYLSFEDLPPSSVLPSAMLAAGAALSESTPIGADLVPSRSGRDASGLGLLAVAQIAAAIALLAGLYFGLSRYQLAGAEASLEREQATHAQLSEQLTQEKRRAELEAATLDAHGEIDILRAKRDSGMALIRDIDQKGGRSDSSFSNLLTTLARQDLEGVWLERIELRDSGNSISLEGRALEANDVPTFLRGLGTERTFADRRFRRFRMDRQNPAAPGIGFRVATEAEDLADAGDRR